MRIAISIFDQVAKGDNKSMGAALFDVGEILGARGQTKAKRAAGARQRALAGAASGPRATAAVSSKRELDESWAACCYEQRMSFAIFDSEPFKEAVKATSQLFFLLFKGHLLREQIHAKFRL